jgi:hypothetical protein
MNFQERQFIRISLACVMAVGGLSAIAIVAYAATNTTPFFADRLFLGNSVGWLGAVWFAFNALVVVPLFGSTVKQFLSETPGHEEPQYVLSSLQ